MLNATRPFADASIALVARRRRLYRMVGAFELVIRPADTATLPLIDAGALLRWARSLLRESGFQLHAAAANEEALHVVAVANGPRAVFRLATWFPTLEARPLHSVEAYIEALARVQQVAREK